MKIFLNFIGIIGILLLLQAQTQAQEQKLRVAVFDPTTSGIAMDEGTKLAVQELISSAFVNTGRFIIVERSMIDKIMKEQAFQNSDMADNSQATEVGKLAGANKIVLSAVSLVGGRNMLSIKIIDVQTATVDQQKTKIVSSNDLLDAVEPLTLELLGEKVVYTKQETQFISQQKSQEKIEELEDEKEVTNKVTIPQLKVDLTKKQLEISIQIEQNIEFVKSNINTKKNKTAIMDTTIILRSGWSCHFNNGVLTFIGNGIMRQEDNAIWQKTISKSQVKVIIIEAGIASVVGFKNFNSLEYVKLSETVNSIEDGTFEGCKFLKAINIPKTISKIGKAAFSNCKNLECVVLPNSLNNIGVEAFYGCENLSFINIPTSLKEIKDRMLKDCKSLSEIIIHAGINSIGISAFENCRNLHTLFIPDNVLNIGASAFSGLKSLTMVRLSENLTNIPKEAFNKCENLGEITIPKNVNNIGENAFAYCKSLYSITILSSSVASIGKKCFDECKNLTKITILSINPPQIKGIFEDDRKDDEEYYNRVLVYVPPQSVLKYKKAYDWDEFKTILPYNQ
ncbi:leucine-rich repeat protein [Bacteroidales bacterium OttesenSCG-928-I21]|nr:leucine-rich repeat protein [Bacteroidales bacterium OttesenSCG-928-I21]